MKYKITIIEYLMSRHSCYFCVKKPMSKYHFWWLLFQVSGAKNMLGCNTFFWPVKA
uniref:Uncharacterized protein n=1 Tax=Rhizophora mucronata TaxID=61149 RepID=A0A2P2N247_RHIMU